MAMAMMAVSAGMQVLGSIYEGNAAAAQSTAAANSASSNADLARLQSNAREETQRRRNAMQLGDLRASAAQSGFDPSGGSFATLQAKSAAEMELDVLTNRYDSELQAISFDNEATNMRSRARAQKRTGYLNAAGSVFNSGANYFGAPRIGPPAPVENRMG